MGDIAFEISSRYPECSVQKPEVTEFRKRSARRREDPESCSDNSDSPSEPDLKPWKMGDIAFEIISWDPDCSVQKPAVTKCRKRSARRREDSESCSDNSDSLRNQT
jgi:hypothetical protein